MDSWERFEDAARETEAMLRVTEALVTASRSQMQQSCALIERTQRVSLETMRTMADAIPSPSEIA